MHSEEPVTLYIVTESVDKQRLQPLVRVLINMIVRLSATGLSFEGGMPKPNYRHRLLLMLDEFPSLGKLDILQESDGCSNGACRSSCVLSGREESCTKHCLEGRHDALAVWSRFSIRPVYVSLHSWIQVDQFEGLQRSG